MVHAQNGWQRKIGYHLIQYAATNRTRSILWYLVKLFRNYKQKLLIFNIFWPVGGSSLIVKIQPQVHFCVNFIKCVNTLYENDLVHRKSFCRHCLNMIWVNFGENQTKLVKVLCIYLFTKLMYLICITFINHRIQKKNKKQNISEKNMKKVHYYCKNNYSLY